MGSPPLHPGPSDARRRRRNVAAFAIVCGVLVWAASLFYLFSTGEGNRADPNTDARDREKPPPTMEILYNYDATDPEQLVLHADAVFVGRVKRESGEQPLTSTIPGDSKPQTQFEVTVLDPISGEVEEGRGLTVNQLGGKNLEDGRDYVVAGVVGQSLYTDAMLVRGGEYLFVVTKSPRTGFWDITAQPQGKVPLSDVSPTERREIISTFEKAGKAARGGGYQPAANSLEGE